MSFDETAPEMAGENAAPSPPKSFLIADCGSSNTTVALFDEAAGSYRLIMRATVPTTTPVPWNDIKLGIRHAIEQISAKTGRKLLNERGDLIRPARASGTGIDTFAAVVSAAPPLNTILAGLSDKVSLVSARTVLKSTYTQELDTFSLADTRSESDQVTSLVHLAPDLIFVVGGTDGGAEDRLLNLLENIKIGALALSPTKSTHILFAGNKDLREKVRSTLGENILLHVAENVRPTLDLEQLDDAGKLINKLYEAIKIKPLPGFQDINEWSNIPAQPTTRALANIAGYFASLQKGRVLAFDLGSHYTSLVQAVPDATPQMWIQSDLGMGQHITNLLDKVQLADINRWLPSSVTEAEIHTYIQNKALFPRTMPLTETELHLEQAIAREILRCVTEEAVVCWQNGQSEQSPLRMVLLRGQTLTSAPRANQALLILLDVLQSTGVFSVALDTYGVLPALGVLAVHESLGAVQALEGGSITNLGWVVVPSGKGQPGQKALDVVLESDEEQHLEVEVEFGAIETLPLPPGQTVKVTLRPSRRFDIGFGPGKEKTITIHGGTIGLVIDARGRPLQLPFDDTARQDLIRQWLWGIGG